MWNCFFGSLAQSDQSICCLLAYLLFIEEPSGA